MAETTASNCGFIASGVEVRHIDDSIGRGLFALRDFKEGDVLFEERPLVCCQFLWNAAYGYLACDFCMRPLETAEENARRLTARPALTLPHPECCDTEKAAIVDCPHCDVSYCSEQCRQMAWQHYHQLMCRRSFTRDLSQPLDQLQESWKKIHYPPETACIMLVARILATIRQAADKEGATSMFLQFCHRTLNEEEEIAHKLLGDQFSEQLELLRSSMSAALYSPEIHQFLTPAGFRSMMALVGTNGQGVGTSALSVWVRNITERFITPSSPSCTSSSTPSTSTSSQEQRKQLDSFIDQLYEDLDKESGSFLNNEGSALYPLQSSCNHSCTPNASPSFPYNNHVLVMNASQPIAAGQQVFVCYLDECAQQRSRHSRAKLLRENYLFHCRCERCVREMAEQEDESSEEEMEDEEEEEDDMGSEQDDNISMS